MWRPSNVDRPTGIFIGLVVISLVLITLDLRAQGEGLGSTLRDGTQALFSPLQEAFVTVGRPIADLLESASDLFSLRDENRRLREEVASLEAEIQATESIRIRVRELEALLGVDAPEEIDTIAARVLAIGVSEFDHLRVIDKGSSDGIGLDMPVRDEGGLVGRVVAVTANVARVMLITDPTMVIAVRVERTGETGVLRGRGSGPMGFEMFDRDAAVIVGDVLVSADGRFPAGIPVAVVRESARSEVGYRLLTTADPAAGITRIDFVKILLWTRDDAVVEGFEGGDRLPTPVPLDPAGPTEGETELAP
ncbi:MAG TPA: rod shape-determining protein MreC, partial [Actinobacteria bacterium]|nr:rod shape-determining protein MreC [Actinomycetota bacterium]